MEPENLKLLCLKTVITDCQCFKENCNELPISVTILENKIKVLCKKHYEHLIFNHEELDCYYTSESNTPQYAIYLGNNTVYIYNYPKLNPIIKYKNIKNVIFGKRFRKLDDIDCVLIEIKKGLYLLIADYICIFKTKDEIKSLFSYKTEIDHLTCCAIGKEYVFYFPYYRPESHYMINKKFYPDDMNWEEKIIFQSIDTLSNQISFNSTLLHHENY